MGQNFVSTRHRLPGAPPSQIEPQNNLRENETEQYVTHRDTSKMSNYNAQTHSLPKFANGKLNNPLLRHLFLQEY